MNERAVRRATALAALLVVSCGGDAAPAPELSRLPAGAVARAGSEVVSPATVSRIAAAQGVSLEAALGAAISDGLFAHAARTALAPASVRSLERAAAARAVLEQLGHEAELQGAPSAAELSKIVQERWTDLNRPASVRTTHAVVLNQDPARDAAARALAERLLVALGAAKSESELIAIAGAFPADGFEIRAEALPFVTADARVMERRDGGFVAQPGTFDPEFARAAVNLTEVGQLSGVVKSAFGYHVIRLEERAPGSIVDGPELSQLLGDEVRLRRAKRARRELVDRLRAAKAIHVERAVEELTAQVKLP